MATPPHASAEAALPGGGNFKVTPEALEMIGVFGGALYCYEGPGGCRAKGLYFSLTTPRKAVRSEIVSTPGGDLVQDAVPQVGAQEAADLQLSVSRELAARLDGAVLDFGNYNGVQRFIWLELPGVKGPHCSCRRSFGTPAGKRSPCLDKQRLGLSSI